ncbi:MAG: DUF2764 family protein [Bacteroidales bacterium]|jgi:hypothetical protein|nr:DUF2764 family protein [Bacteroidales bacterium]MDD3166797.1 DUF2764 family protein [Bacteroidales bacterium]MDD4771252.1 DUF2764 family protein [Bacteroidales bacterium]HKL93160.1 DUF2764 family protein [Bacteroidales bacterium]
MREYHYLVAGLPDLSPEETRLRQRVVEFREQLEAAFSDEDNALLALYFIPYEMNNLLRWLRQGKEAELDGMGRLDIEDFAEQWDRLDYEHAAPVPGIPPFFLPFMRDWKAEQFAGMPDYAIDNHFFGLYYAYAMNSDNAFTADWFEFQLNLSNLQTAYLCRKTGLDAEMQIVGDNEVAEVLRSSAARDFGIATLFPPTENVLRILEDSLLLEREKRIDQLKWDYLEEIVFFHYFSVEKLLSHLLQLQMLERWIELDPETGQALFRKWIKEMKDAVEKPEIK